MERRLAAILAADIVGYSRLMEADEADTFARLKSTRENLIDPKIAAHKGRIVKLMGDGALIEFSSVVDAVGCAVEIQRTMAECNAELPKEKQLEFRIGVNLGDVIVEGQDIYGDGVNVAARLEGLAEPGGVLISGTAFDQVERKLDFEFEFLGEQQAQEHRKTCSPVSGRPAGTRRVRNSSSKTQTSYRMAPADSRGDGADPDRRRCSALEGARGRFRTAGRGGLQGKNGAPAA